MEALRPSESISSRLEDSQIVTRILAGEKELFEILLRRNNQTLYRVIRSYLKDANDVQDAMRVLRTISQLLTCEDVHTIFNARDETSA